MMMDAKKQTLRQIMDLMDGHMMGKLPKKGAPRPPAAAPVAEAAPEAAPAQDAEALDAEAMRQLSEMYEKDTGDDDLETAEAVPMA